MKNTRKKTCVFAQNEDPKKTDRITDICNRRYPCDNETTAMHAGIYSKSELNHLLNTKIKRRHGDHSRLFIDRTLPDLISESLWNDSFYNE